MPTHSTANPKEFAWNMLLCIWMLVLTVAGIAYVIVRDGILEERYGKHNPLAHANVYEASVIFLVFLVAPFVGGCSAFRLARSADRSTKIIGWLFVVMFSMFFLQAAAVCWTDYQNYFRFLRG